MKTDIKKAIKCVNYLKGKNDILVERGVKVEESNPEGCLLFIGINPSFKNGDLMPSSPEYKSTYPWDIPDEKTHSYFIKSKRIANSEGIHLPYGHHDLFPIREANQKVIENMFDTDSKGSLITKNDYNSFIKESLSWSQETIRECNPKIIVVINAFASRIVFDYSLLGFIPEKRWNEDLGVDFIQINGNMVPIMFSGMLSGQRALDNQSEFRLMWHIRHVLRHLELWPKQ